MTRVMIVDDEPLAADVLKRYAESLPDVEVVGPFHDPRAAFAALQQEHVDILLLDIQMPGITGLQLTQALRNPPAIVFTTAFREFAVEGFELNVLDYLVKPISFERFLKAMDKYYGLTQTKENQSEGTHASIFLRSDKEMVRIVLDDIRVVESLKNYVRIHTRQGDHVVYYTLSYLEGKLPSGKFMRVHKSFLVNLDHVERYSPASVVVNKQEIPIGRTYQEAVLKKLQGLAI